MVITKDGRPVAVLASPDEFANWKETMAVRLDADLTKEIKSGLEALKSNKAALYTLEELVPE